MVTETSPPSVDDCAALPSPLNDVLPPMLRLVGLMKLSGPVVGGVTPNPPLRAVFELAALLVEVLSVSSTVTGSPIARARCPSYSAA